MIKSRLLGNFFGREIDRYLQEKCEKENEKGIGKKGETRVFRGIKGGESGGVGTSEVEYIEKGIKKMLFEGEREKGGEGGGRGRWSGGSHGGEWGGRRIWRRGGGGGGLDEGRRGFKRDFSSSRIDFNRPMDGE